MLLRFGNPLLLVNIDYIDIENRILLLFTYRWYCYDLQLIQLNTVCFRVKVTTVKANEAISLRQWLWNKYIFIRFFLTLKVLVFEQATKTGISTVWHEVIFSKILLSIQRPFQQIEFSIQPHADWRFFYTYW